MASINVTVPPTLTTVIFAGVKHAFRHGYPGSQVVDAVHILELGPQLGPVVDIAAVELNFR